MGSFNAIWSASITFSDSFLLVTALWIFRRAFSLSSFVFCSSFLTACKSSFVFCSSFLTACESSCGAGGSCRAASTPTAVVNVHAPARA